MNLYNSFETDKDLETKGVWVEYGDGTPAFLVARAGGANKSYTVKTKKLTKAYRRAIQTETLSDDIADRIYMESFYKTVILDWKGVEDREGEDLPFSLDNMKKLFTDLPELWADLRDQATSIAIFRKEVEEADAKNS